MISPSSIRAIGPPIAASGEIWPMQAPRVAPEKRPSVINATEEPTPEPTQEPVKTPEIAQAETPAEVPAVNAGGFVNFSISAADSSALPESAARAASPTHAIDFNVCCLIIASHSFTPRGS